MKYFYDTEFIEDGKTIDLISIGIVAEDGREYYAQAVECDFTKANEWVIDNVLVHLQKCPQNWQKIQHQTGRCRNDCPFDLRRHIANVLRNFCNPEVYGKPEFWGYYSAYDHVALCQLFGKMIDLPKGFPMYTRDIKQLCDSYGNPKLPEQGKGEHHALADARWNQQAYNFIISLSPNLD